MGASTTIATTKMRVSYIFAALALTAVVYSAPLSEDDWDANDVLLQRLHEDGLTPLSELMQTPKGEEHANAEHAKAKAAQNKAQAEEDAATKDEAASTRRRPRP